MLHDKMQRYLTEPHQEDVIVNRFGDTNDRAYDISILQLLVDGIGCCITPIAPHHIQVGQPPQVYSAHNLLQVSAASGGTLQGCTRNVLLCHQL